MTAKGVEMSAATGAGITLCSFWLSATRSLDITSRPLFGVRQNLRLPCINVQNVTEEVSDALFNLGRSVITRRLLEFCIGLLFRNSECFLFPTMSRFGWRMMVSRKDAGETPSLSSSKNWARHPGFARRP
jgi:hypothetical protein